MAVHQRPARGYCPSCGDQRAASIGPGKLQCRSCFTVWSPDDA